MTIGQDFFFDFIFFHRVIHRWWITSVHRMTVQVDICHDKADTDFVILVINMTSQ